MSAQDTTAEGPPPAGVSGEVCLRALLVQALQPAGSRRRCHGEAALAVEPFAIRNAFAAAAEP